MLMCLLIPGFSFLIIIPRPVTREHCQFLTCSAYLSSVEHDDQGMPGSLPSSAWLGVARARLGFGLLRSATNSGMLRSSMAGSGFGQLVLSGALSGDWTGRVHSGRAVV